MTKNKIILLLLGIFFFRLILSFLTWHPDLFNHMDWGIRFYEYGPKLFYAPSSNVWSFTWPNQPPGTIYMFAAIRFLFEKVFSFLWYINVNIESFPSIIVSFSEKYLYQAMLKIPAILADFGIAFFIYKFVKLLSTEKNKEKVAYLAAIIWLVNPIVWYNSTVWGQYDSVINFFALSSFYFLFSKRLAISTLLIIMSFYIKPSLLIFAPIWAISFLRLKFNLKSILASSLIGIVFVGLLTLPFSQGNVFVWLFNLYTQKIFVQQLHLITANAFNFWSLIAGIHERPDTQLFLNIQFKNWSYFIYTGVYLYICIKLLKNFNIKNVIFSLAVVGLASFTLLTNMHERYLYPLFAPLTILLILRLVNNFYYWLISLIHLLNLYNFWFVPKIAFLVYFLSFSDRLMPRVFGGAIFLLFIALLWKYNKTR